MTIWIDGADHPLPWPAPLPTTERATEAQLRDPPAHDGGDLEGLLAAGCTNKVIAAELHVRDTTVGQVMWPTLVKLGVNTRSAAMSVVMLATNGGSVVVVGHVQARDTRAPDGEAVKPTA